MLSINKSKLSPASHTYLYQARQQIRKKYLRNVLASQARLIHLRFACLMYWDT